MGAVRQPARYHSTNRRHPNRPTRGDRSDLHRPPTGIMPQTVATRSDAAPTAAVLEATERAPGLISRLRGLDGLRAIAVLVVLAYHAGFAQAQGGFLGVEVFFVISGYLITALLLDEHRRNGRIDPVRFWFRRARRLLPALFFLLAATLAVAVVVVPEEVARLRTDALAALAYVTNW